MGIGRSSPPRGRRPSAGRTRTEHLAGARAAVSGRRGRDGGRPTTWRTVAGGGGGGGGPRPGGGSFSGPFRARVTGGASPGVGAGGTIGGGGVMRGHGRHHPSGLRGG